MVDFPVNGSLLIVALYDAKRGAIVVANRSGGIRGDFRVLRDKGKVTEPCTGTSRPCEVMFQSRHRKTDIATLMTREVDFAHFSSSSSPRRAVICPGTRKYESFRDTIRY